jgi:quercetin dioxygenase-like cupin family protein
MVASHRQPPDEITGGRSAHRISAAETITIRVMVSRVLLACGMVAIFCVVDRAPLSPVATPRAQAPASPVPINDEPHHKRLLYTNDLRLWDVTLPPGQSTPPFIHDYDVATVVIGDGMLNIQRNGEPPSPPSPNARGAVVIADHTGARATYRIENNGTTEYRAFEVENMREGGWPSSQPFTAPGSSVLKESRAFTIYDVGLKAGSPEVMHDHMGSRVIVILSGTLQQAGIGGTDPVRISQPGQWLSLPRFQTHAVTTVGNADAHAIEIEVR